MGKCLSINTGCIAGHRWASLDDGADAPQQKPKKMQKGRFTETAKASAARSEVSETDKECKWARCPVEPWNLMSHRW